MFVPYHVIFGSHIAPRKPRIQYDACSELNWEGKNGKFPLSNACGQSGRQYQDENCAQGSTEFFSCEVDVNMEVTAVSQGLQARAPPPLQCGPDVSGYWDVASQTVQDSTLPNTSGRTDAAGCCWFGRGSLHTRNVCNIGKFSKLLLCPGQPLVHIDFRFALHQQNLYLKTTTSGKGEPSSEGERSIPTLISAGSPNRSARQDTGASFAGSLVSSNGASASSDTKRRLGTTAAGWKRSSRTTSGVGRPSTASPASWPRAVTRRTARRARRGCWACAGSSPL